MRLTRRIALRSLALGATVALAGCTAPSSPGDSGGPTYEVHQVGPSSATPEWSGRDDEAGAVELYRSGDRARDRLTADLLSGVAESRREAALGFVEDTDFGRSVLLYAASEGPDTCYNEVEIRDLVVEDDTLTGTAAAIDTSDPGEGCGDALTYPAALVRVTGDPVPARAELTVINGWGESTLVATATG